MTDSVPGISFDDQGLCSYCREFKKETYIGKEQRDAIVAEARGEEALRQDEEFQKTILDVGAVRRMLIDDIGLSPNEADRILSP